MVAKMVTRGWDIPSSFAFGAGYSGVYIDVVVLNGMKEAAIVRYLEDVEILATHQFSNIMVE